MKALLTVLLMLLALPARGSDVEAMVTQYEDFESRQRAYSVKLQGDHAVGKSLLFSLRLGSTQTDFTGLDGTFVDKKQAAYNAGLVTSYDTYSLGLNYVEVREGSGRMRSPSVNIAKWFLDDTLQLQYDFGRTRTSQDQIIKYDAQADILFLPTYVEGETHKLSFLGLATPTTILMGYASATRRSDRPDARQTGGEWREALPSLDSSVHIQAAEFHNYGSVTRESDYGKLKAHSIAGTWNYTVPTAEKHYILSLTHRYYEEREEEDPIFHTRDLTSQWTSLALRYRAGSGPWTLERNEIYGVAARYRTDEPRTGTFVGIGGKLLLGTW